MPIPMIAKAHALALQQYSDYVSGIACTDEEKQFMLDECFLSKVPSFFLHYPAVFAPACNYQDDDALRRFNIATFMYYKYLMHEDHIIDEPQSSARVTVRDMQNMVILLEESVKLLAGLFLPASPFWSVWSPCRQEYLFAILHDHMPMETMNDDMYERIAIGKAAFAQAAIDGVFLLADRFDDQLLRSQLHASHRLFTIAMHIVDDVRDLAQDLEHPQCNFAFMALAREFQKYGRETNDKSPEYLHKMFYAMGIGEKVLLRAIDYYQQALEKISAMPLPLWQTILTEQIEVCQEQISGLNAYLAELETRINT